MSCVYNDVIEPGLARISVLVTAHEVRRAGRDFTIVQTVSRNVLTEFDGTLSRHLSAMGQEAFPAFTVSVEVTQDGKNRRHLASSHHASVPHALRWIAERALVDGKSIDLTITMPERRSGDRAPISRTERVNSESIAMLDAALGVCDRFGDPEFMEISGDFDVVIASPPGGMLPVMLHLRAGTVSVPRSTAEAGPSFVCPVFAFAQHASQDRVAQSYLARAQQALLAEKEAAIHAFRAAAERRILDFDRALGGRSLQGPRFDAAAGLAARLIAGLGETLSGLSEDSRIIALDWCAQIDCKGDARAEARRSA